MRATDTAEMIAAIAEITTAIGSRPVGRPPPIFCWTFLALPEQQQTDQKGPADCDTDRQHFARHVAALRAHRPGYVTNCALQKTPLTGPYWSANVAEPFIDHSSEI
jgi:hypothetical protein